MSHDTQIRTSMTAGAPSAFRKLARILSATLCLTLCWGALGSANAQTQKSTTQKAAKGGKNVNVVIETSLGKMEVELNAEAAPKTVANFLAYVDKKHYDGTIFHRVIPGFMIQGGGMDANMKEKSTGEPIKNEATNGLKNDRGTLAMARTNIVDSATAQFFINVKDNAFLNHKAPNPREFGYAVFGKVTSGMEVADQIVAVPRGRKGPHDDVPETPVTIISIRRK
jgi:cyclophilin family peptidyl-prolyl cis-trans isomerase